jgi:GGDEF domain-containing protein
MDLSLSLVESLRDHLFYWDQPHYESVRAELDRILDALKNQPPPSTVLVYAGTLAEKVEYHCHNVQRMVDGSVSELQDIIRVLISAMDEVRTDSEKAASELRNIEEMIARTSTADQLRLAKVYLAHALQRLREKEEDRRQKAAKLVITHDVNSRDSYDAGAPLEISEASPPTEAPSPPPLEGGQFGNLAAHLNRGSRQVNADEPQLDPFTGLPNKAAAKDCFALLGPNPAHVYAAAFFVRQMEQINARYGSKTGNEVLSLCAQHIGRVLLRPADQLFRWDGPRFVALLEREDSLMDVRRELRRVIPGRFRCELRAGSMLLSVAVAADAISITSAGAGEIMEELEKIFAQSLLHRTS